MVRVPQQDASRALARRGGLPPHAPSKWSKVGCPVGFDKRLDGKLAGRPAGSAGARLSILLLSHGFPDMAFFGNDAVNRVNIHYAIQALAQGEPAALLVLAFCCTPASWSR